MKFPFKWDDSVVWATVMATVTAMGTGMATGMAMEMATGMAMATAMGTYSVKRMWYHETWTEWTFSSRGIKR